MKTIQAEEIAIGAFAWLSEQSELASGFLGMSGASAEELRSGAERPEFLGFVLDFILSEDNYVVECAQELGVSPEQIVFARQALPGGDNPEWT